MTGTPCAWPSSGVLPTSSEAATPAWRSGPLSPISCAIASPSRSRRCSGRAIHHARRTRAAVPLEVLVGEIPVDQVSQERGDIVQAAMLVVEVVGMLPDVDGQQRPLRGGQGGSRVRGGDDLQLVVLEHEPRPAAAELVTRSADELLAEGPLASEG